MESSSENSFAWTDTSSDSIKTTSMPADDINDNFKDISADNGKKTKCKKSRKKHNDKSISSEPNVVIKEEKAYFETKSNSSLKKNIIKIEPESDNDKCKKKKKIKNLITNGDGNDLQDYLSYDETYLNLKVKQEESSAASFTKHKKKKRKRTSSIDSSSTPLKSHENNSSSVINDSNVTLKVETENDTEMSKHKKKKKSKKHNGGDNLHLDIVDKMDIEETVVNKKSNGNNSFITENITLQEESSGDEISAIKCNDSHSPQTISVINKSIEENTEVNCNNKLNIITKLAHRVPEYNLNEKLEATEHRKQRISDRIRFEDDDDTNTEPSQVEHESQSENNKKPLKLKHFLKTNPSLKLLPETFNINSNLTKDDEIWILKCPKEINIKDFDNTTLNINAKCKIKVGGQTYEGSAAEEQSDTISLLIMEQNKYKIRNVPLSGVINLRKRIPKAHFRDDNIMMNNQTNFIPLPETKCRHPLFGANYKKALKIPAAIAERLNVQDNEDTIRTAKRKKKKSKKERNTSEQVDPKEQSDFTFKTEPELSVKIREKKTKKRKLIDNEGSVPKNVKRIKHDPESAEAWESEQAIEDNLFNF